MTAVDTVTAFLDQLDDMISIFSLYNLRYTLRIRKVECHIGKLRHQVSLAHKSHLTATGCRSWIFGIQAGQRRELHLTAVDLFRKITQTCFDSICHIKRNLRFESNDLDFHCCRDSRQTVFRQLIIKLTNFRRSHLDLPDQFALHF